MVLQFSNRCLLFETLQYIRRQIHIIKLQGVKNRRRDPGHEVAEIHARGRGEPIPRFLGEAEDAQVAHADVHRHVAEPGEEHDVPKCELGLAGKRIAALPDVVLGTASTGQPSEWISVSGSIDELPKADQAERQEHSQHPRRGEVGEPRQRFVPKGRDGRERNSRRRRTAMTHPTLLGQASLSGGIGKLNHTPTAVAETVIIDPARMQNIAPLARLYSVTSLRPRDFFELVVERQPGPRGDRRGQERPAQHGQHVAQQQADDQVERADARRRRTAGRSSARSRRMLAGVHADEAAEAQQAAARAPARVRIRRRHCRLGCSSVMGVAPPEMFDGWCVK